MLLMEDIDNRTPLHYAVSSQCSIEVLKYLLNATSNMKYIINIIKI